MILTKIINYLLKKEVTFTLALFADEKLSLNVFDEKHLILKRNLRGLWNPKPLLYQADPFLFVKGKQLYLFYELQNWDDPGYIVMIKTSDLKTWSEPKVVLKEPFHLSFPFVFEDHGTIYMIPESQEDNSVRLYRANDDLSSFSYVRTLLKKKRNADIVYSYNDSHIYYNDGKYFLFTSYQEDWMYFQELYVAQDLLNDEFVKHPDSPICVSNEFGRNGGSLIVFNGKLLRVTQDCHEDYGDNVSLMEVLKIDAEHYDEILFKHNIVPHNSIFVDGGHQLNISYFDGKYIYALDYKIKVWIWYRLYVSFMKKIGFHKRKNR